MMPIESTPEFQKFLRKVKAMPPEEVERRLTQALAKIDGIGSTRAKWLSHELMLAEKAGCKNLYESRAYLEIKWKGSGMWPQ